MRGTRSQVRPSRPAPSDPGRGTLARRRLSLVDRLDEAAQPLHDVIVVKLVLNVMTGLGSSLIVPWRICLAWTVIGLLIEGWLWLATRPQARLGGFDRPGRANFLMAYAANNLWWLALGALFWISGAPVAQATAAALFLTVAAVGVMLFYNVPAVFFLAGAAPAVGALAVLALAKGLELGELAPVWIVLALGALFSVGRALDTPSAQEAQRRLNAALDDYETLAANVSDVIARTNLDGAYEYVSPAAETVLGYHPDELIGTSRWSITHPDTDREAMRRAFKRLLADPARSEVMTVRVRRKDGRWIWLQSSGRLILEDGVPVATIDVSRDVTVQVETEAALQEAKAEAESATRAKAEFLANVSHEIRTPMNGVLGALQLLDREPISDEGRELMRQAGDCGRMLSQLLNDVLDFSKIEAGQLDLSPEPMKPGEALQAVVGLLDGQARAKGVALRSRIRGGDLWIDADPVRLRQAMFNLIGNAVKFTSDGRVEARLEVRNAGEGVRRVRLEVEDTGVGMTPAAQERLFDRFHQAEGDTARRFGGAGLGLSITRALLRMMGGEIAFKSVAGVGSTFWFEFTAPAAAAPEAAADAEADVLEGVRILLVEDNPTNRLVARTLLTRLGAEVTVAEDGVAGVDAARRDAFDLILMDIQMPHMGGLEAAQAIRGLKGPEGKVPILALTANAMTHQRAEYLAAGMNGMVAKPISAPALISEIARILVEDDPRGPGAPAALAAMD